MLAWVDGNLNEGGAEERTLDARDRKVGLFGDFLEARQHGKFVEWVAEPTGYSLRPCRAASGEVVTPKVVMLMEYILKMAIGDGEACPKGGRPRKQLFLPVRHALREVGSRTVSLYPRRATTATMTTS